MALSIKQSHFATFEGKPVTLYTLTETNGIAVSVINYGATITNILVPDKKGILVDVVLGFTNLQGYIDAPNIYMGSICGRYANRIANATFEVNGKQHHLQKNDGENNLHGGVKGFDKVYWNASIVENNEAIKFNYLSLNGEEGFDGELDVSVTYTIKNSALHIDYTATTDKATPVNFTSHCYFNLSGGIDKTIYNHHLKINAKYYLALNNSSIPTGEILPVTNTIMNFLEMQQINDHAYDNCWILDKQPNELAEVALLQHVNSGISMQVFTTEPALQFYTGNYLNNTLKNTKVPQGYIKNAGLCLEAQHYPDSPNHKNFPNTILQPGEVYNQQTIYSFLTT